MRQEGSGDNTLEQGSAESLRPISHVSRYYNLHDGRDPAQADGERNHRGFAEMGWDPDRSESGLAVGEPSAGTTILPNSRRALSGVRQHFLC
jgi:hypothetical protein